MINTIFTSVNYQTTHGSARWPSVPLHLPLLHPCWQFLKNPSVSKPYHRLQPLVPNGSLSPPGVQTTDVVHRLEPKTHNDWSWSVYTRTGEEWFTYLAHGTCKCEKRVNVRPCTTFRGGIFQIDQIQDQSKWDVRMGRREKTKNILQEKRPGIVEHNTDKRKREI